VPRLRCRRRRRGWPRAVPISAPRTARPVTVWTCRYSPASAVRPAPISVGRCRGERYDANQPPAGCDQAAGLSAGTAGQARAARWSAQCARVRAAVPVVGRGVVLVGPIVFPMAVAWIGQIAFALHVLHWVLPGAVCFAPAWELSTAYVARLAYLARQDGD